MIFILHRKDLRKESPGDGSAGLLSFWILTLGPVLALALDLALDQDLALASSPLVQALGLSQDVLTVKQ